MTRLVATSMLLMLAAVACSDRSKSAAGAPGVATDRASPCAALPVVAELRGERYQLVLHEGADDTLYTVKDTAGRLLVACASADVLATHHPEIYDFVSAVIHRHDTPQMGYVP